MFGRKKMYKKGLADAMQAYEAFGKKQEDALAYMREEVRSGNKELKEALAGLGDELNGIYKYLNAQEKAALYQLSTPMDLKELDEADKRLLLAVLYQLAENEENALTDNQRAYIRSVQKYLEITNPQTFADLSAIENIDSIDVQKTFLRVVLEFFYLQDSDELSDEQEAVFDYFSVNKKQATVIENEVSRLFNAVGPEGVAEKYGYVPEEEPEPVAPVDMKDVPVFTENVPSTSFVGTPVSGEIMDYIFSNNKVDRYTGCWAYETSNYILFHATTLFRIFPKGLKSLIDTANSACHIDSDLLSNDNLLPDGWYRFDKSTSQIKRLDVKLSFYNSDKPLIDGDKFVYFVHDDAKNSINEGDMWLLDLNTLQAPEKLFAVEFDCKRISLYGDRIVFLDDGMPYLYSLSTKKITRIMVPPTERTTHYQMVYATESGVYIGLYDHPHHKMYFYDYSTGKVNLLFTDIEINEIYHVEDKKIYCQIYDLNYKFGMIDLATIQVGSAAKLNVKYDVMVHNGDYSIQPYGECILYVSNSRTIKKLNYKTGEIIEIANDAAEYHHDDGGLFRKGGFWYTPCPIKCIGGWVYYPTKGDTGKYCRVSLDNPEEIGFLPNT